MANLRICSVPDCGKPVKSHGWCDTHYRRWLKYGTPSGGVRTPNGEPGRYFRETVLAYDGDECLVWPYSKSAAGYGQMWEAGQLRYVHRRACEEEHGPPPSPQHHAAHSCGNGHTGCCTKRHLSWKTPGENAADKLVHGTHHRGERHGQAKLTRDQVREIRSLEGEISQSAIANRFGIDQAYVGQIQRRLCWGWLE